MALRLWVGGWLTQLMLLLCGGTALWLNRYEQASIFIVGSLVIGVMRQIERERRDPTPRSKV